MSARDATHDATQDRVTIQEAARRLGVKDDALRKRIQRGTLRHEKDPDGRVYVYMDAAHDAAHDLYRDATQYGGGPASGDRGELYEVMRDEIAHLRGQIEEEREARRRADTIIAQLSQATAEQARTIRAIEPPQPTQDGRQDADGGLNRAEVYDAGEGPQKSPQPVQDDHNERRPWWRRIFD